MPPVDSAYAYTEEENNKIKEHKEIYWKFTRDVAKRNLKSLLEKDGSSWKKTPSEMR